MPRSVKRTSKNPRRPVKHALGLYPRDRIDHPVFGLGTIVEIDGRHTTIQFDESGTRKFLTSMVKLADTQTSAKSAPTPKKIGPPA